MESENIRAPIDLGESDDAYMLRRVAEERRKMAETSCIVRSVHEEMLETYEERSAAAASHTKAMDALLMSIDDADQDAVAPDSLGALPDG